MSAIVNQYLDSIKSNLRLETSEEREIITELKSHIDDKISDLRNKGLREEEAAKVCIRLLGSAKSVALQIYEAHSQGSWKQALVASLPHILFGLLFALNWWFSLSWQLILLIFILSTAVYGWWHGKSSWVFPWLGYALLPVVAAGLLLLYLPRAWSWLAILVYIPLALWLILRIVSQTIKKDWLYTSLMLLPMPIITGWFVASQWTGNYDYYMFERISYLAPCIGASFLALGFAVVTFIRLRRRWLKIAVLLIAGLTAISLMAFYAWGKIEFVMLLALILFMVSIFLIPARLENGVRTGKWGKIFEHRPLI